MTIRNKIVSIFLAAVLSTGAVVMPTGTVIDTAITASAEKFDGKIEKITKKVSGTEVTLYWDEVPSASTYRLYKRNSDGKTYKRYSDCKFKKTSDGRIKCIISGLAKNTEYVFAAASVKKNEYGDALVGSKKAVKIKTGSSSSSSKKITTLPDPSKVCSYLKYTDSKDTNDGERVIRLYTGLATYDNYEDYRKYLEDHGLCLDIVDCDMSTETHGTLFTYMYSVFSDSSKKNLLGTIMFGYYLYDDGSGVMVSIAMLRA